MRKKILIVKLGALGDVVRTTVLLRVLKGDIYWLSQTNAGDLLNSTKIRKIFFIDNRIDIISIKKIKFDLVINLDEDFCVLELLKELQMNRLIGVFLNGSQRCDYTSESRYWFDMSLVSKLGTERADELKKTNRRSVPEILLNMVGKTFSGEEYDIGVRPARAKGIIGLINVSSGLWPNKEWFGYPQLSDRLKKEGYKIMFLEMRKTIKEHIDDINRCELIVCGDTLGMHLALALKKKVVALFNCTSPYEIHGYGRLRKIVSPFYEEAFYKKRRTAQVIHSIPVQEVYETVIKMLDRGMQSARRTKSPWQSGAPC